MLSIFHKPTVDSRVLFTGALLALIGAGVVHATTLTVTTTADSGAGSLRQAIRDAASGDTIDFNLSGCPCTITLTSGELVIGKNLTITGPGTDLLTISGNNASRVFFVNPGASGATTGPPATNPVVNISALTIANGKARGGTGLMGGRCRRHGRRSVHQWRHGNARGG